MKKIAATITTLGSLAITGIAFAQNSSPGVNIQITTPGSGINPFLPLGVLISNAITIIFVAASLLVLVFLIIGAFQWITSGGDKEAVGKARSRITNALIGLAILALAFLIVRVVGQILNINLFEGKIPSLSQCPADQTFFPPVSGASEGTCK